MNLATALAKSCDTVFYPMGYEFWRILYPYAGEDGEQGTEDDVLREPLQDDLGKIGFGQFTNIDLPFEKDGRVPDAAWKREIHEANPTAFPVRRVGPGRLHQHVDRAGRHARHTAAAGGGLLRADERRGSPLRPAPARQGGRPDGGSRADARPPVPAPVPRPPAVHAGGARLRPQRARGDAPAGRDRGRCLRRVPVRAGLGRRQDRDGRGRPEAGLLVVRCDGRGAGRASRRRRPRRAGRSRLRDRRADRATHHRGPLRPPVLRHRLRAARPTDGPRRRKDVRRRAPAAAASRRGRAAVRDRPRGRSGCSRSTRRRTVRWRSWARTPRSTSSGRSRSSRSRRWC